jgi:hypothetical protein
MLCMLETFGSLEDCSFEKVWPRNVQRLHLIVLCQEQLWEMYSM